jgi:hypothetical protein
MKCKNCNQNMTFAAQKVQYKRLIQKNYSKEEINKITPLCHKCLTTYLKNTKMVEGVETYLT